MRFLLVGSLLLATSACSASSTPQASEKAPALTSAKATVSPEIEYENKIDNRASGIVRELGLIEEPKASAVKQSLLGFYRSLNAWQNTNEKGMKALKNASHDKDPAIAAKAKADLEQLLDTRKTLRIAFLETLSRQLNAEQITKVKDLLTYNKVQVTFTVYCAQNPWFSEADKAKVKAWLIEAREESLDGGSADEKSDIFNKFKGRINNYISKNKPAK